MKRTLTSINPNDSPTKILTLTDILQAMSVIGPTPLRTNYEQQMRQFRSQRNPMKMDRFGYSKSEQHSLYMDNDDDDDADQEEGAGRTDFIDRPFSLAFLDGNNGIESNHDDPSPKSNRERWETIFGNFYDIGTLEIDPITLDVLVQYIRQILQSSDDSHNDGKNNNNDNNNDLT
jgi:hypothetical protein